MLYYAGHNSLQSRANVSPLLSVSPLAPPAMRSFHSGWWNTNHPQSHVKCSRGWAYCFAAVLPSVWCFSHACWWVLRPQLEGTSANCWSSLFSNALHHPECHLGLLNSGRRSGSASGPPPWLVARNDLLRVSWDSLGLASSLFLLSAIGDTSHGVCCSMS